MIRRIAPWLALIVLLGIWSYSDALLPAPNLTAPTATVVDGDTFTLSDKTIRLYGIDAPEYHQDCTDASGKTWACGKAARARLAEKLASGTVTCAPQAHDRYGRTVARCSTADEPDLGRAMVHAGLAISPAERGTAVYHEDQNLARQARRGLWQGVFDEPAVWRASHPRADASLPLIRPPLARDQHFP